MRRPKVREGLLLALLTPLALSDQDERPAPDLELLVDASAWASDGSTTRSGLVSRRGGDTGIEPAFDAGGASLTGGERPALVDAPQLIDDPAASAAAARTRASICCAHHSRMRPMPGPLPCA